MNNIRKNFTKEMLIELKETYDEACDNHCDGTYLHYRKLPIIFKALGLDMTSDIESLVRVKENEILEENEYLGLIYNVMSNTTTWCAAETTEAYTVFDYDKSGYLDPSEIKRVFTQLREDLSLSEIEDQLRKFDANGDMVMSLSEFATMNAATKGSDYDFDNI